MKILISKTARAVAFLAAVSVTTVLVYVHGVDRQYLGAPSHASLDVATPGSTSFRA